MPDPIRAAAAAPIRRLRGWRIHHRRSRLPRLVLVVAVGLGSGLAVDHALDEAHAARAAWQPGAPVWLLRRDLPAGTVVAADDVALAAVPHHLRPEDATTEDPRGRRLRHPVAAAEILRDARLTDGDRSETAARLGPDRVGLAIEHRGVSLLPGDRVALHALLDGRALTRGQGEVVATGDGQLIVAVDERDVAGVIRSLSTGGVVAVLLG